MDFRSSTVKKLDDPQPWLRIQKGSPSSYRLPKAVNDLQIGHGLQYPGYPHGPGTVEVLKKSYRGSFGAIHKLWILSPALVRSLPLASWLKSVMSRSLKATSSWLSLPGSLGRSISQETLRPVKHGLFIPVTAFYGTI